MHISVASSFVFLLFLVVLVVEDGLSNERVGRIVDGKECGRDQLTPKDSGRLHPLRVEAQHGRSTIKSQAVRLPSLLLTIQILTMLYAL